MNAHPPKLENATKRRLLETAIDLVWEHNYGAVSVDDICRRAGVQKGSFYHFFPSKADLAVAAIEEHWQSVKIRLDEAFDPQIPPLQRLERYCAGIYEHQLWQQQKVGKVCGCPFASLGSEQSTEDEKIRRKSQEIFDRAAVYIEHCLSDAMKEGLIPEASESDLRSKARDVFSFMIGVLLQAKVQNDLRLLQRFPSSLFRLIEVREEAITT